MSMVHPYKTTSKVEGGIEKFKRIFLADDDGDADQSHKQKPQTN